MQIMRQKIPNIGNIKDGHTLRYDLMLTFIFEGQK